MEDFEKIIDNISLDIYNRFAQHHGGDTYIDDMIDRLERIKEVTKEFSQKVQDSANEYFKNSRPDETEKLNEMVGNKLSELMAKCYNK